MDPAPTTSDLHGPTCEISRPKWVHFWLHESTGLPTLRAIAKQIGISPMALTNTINGYRRSAEIQREVARLARRPVEELFGPHTHWSLTENARAARKAS